MGFWASQEHPGLTGLEMGRHAPVMGERRQLTILFADLIGFTELSARLDPEELRDLLRTYQAVVAADVTRFDGTVATFLGDGVMAYFGFPWAHEDDAERAVRTGLAIIGSTRQLRSPAGTGLEVRVGIATGLVVIGDPNAAGPTGIARQSARRPASPLGSRRWRNRAPSWWPRKPGA